MWQLVVQRVTGGCLNNLQYLCCCFFLKFLKGLWNSPFAVHLFSSLLCYFTLLGVFVITIIHCLFLSLSPFNSMNIFLQNYYNYKPVSIFLLLHHYPICDWDHTLRTDDKKGVDRSSTVVARDTTEGKIFTHISGFQNKKSPFPFGNFPSYSHLTTVSCLFCIYLEPFFARAPCHYFFCQKKTRHRQCVF